MVTITSLAQDERTARMFLSGALEPNDSRTGRLVTEVGAVETVRLATTKDAPLPKVLDATEGEFWRQQAAPRLLFEAVKRITGKTDSLALQVLIPGDKDWPKGFAALGDREPLALWVRGSSSFLSSPVEENITFSGARAVSGYGVQVTTELARELARDQYLIVSGGAYGVDAAAHRAALEGGGTTAAVMAGGLGRLYPSGNNDLLEHVGDVGVLVSEVGPETVPTRWRFLARNRLLAALSAATIIPEAGYRSGALHVAVEAFDLGREVGAVPGPVTSATSAGTHRLIREEYAQIVTNANDVRDLLVEPNSTPPPRIGSFRVPERVRAATQRDSI
ncbi:MAG: DNA-protecting protein DprA [Actinobacteria bacterium]|nr:DNA-protecting protein DprA [Actinomycetota bacterium]